MKNLWPRAAVAALVVLSLCTGCIKSGISPTSSVPDSSTMSSSASSSTSREPTREEILSNGILYSWNMSVVTDDERRGQLLEAIEALHITTLYQCFSREYLQEQNSAFIDEMNRAGVEVFHLNGDPSWDAQRMMQEIDRVLLYNMMVQFDLAGIVFDVEPHANPDHTDYDYFAFTLDLKNTYAYAQMNGLYMVAAIPHWLERKGDAILPVVIGEASDEVSVMNYTNTSTRDNISTEVPLAQASGKWINTIYELDFSEDRSFDSLNEIHDDFVALYRSFRYDRLRIAYHHAGDLL